MLVDNSKIKRRQAVRILAGSMPGSVSINPVLIERAEAGELEAQVALAMLHLSSHPDLHDDTAAEKWLRRAAAAGHVQAQIRLGLLLLTREGGRRNAEEAVDWYLAAARQGDAEAQFRLGLLFEMGNGLPRDLVSAHAWYTLARQHGKSMAAIPGRRLRRQLTQAQIEESTRLVARLGEHLQARSQAAPSQDK